MPEFYGGAVCCIRFLSVFTILKSTARFHGRGIRRPRAAAARSRAGKGRRLPALVRNWKPRRIIRGFLARYGGFKPVEAALLGYNTRMDAMEYHRASVVNVAVTDSVVMWASGATSGTLP
jgi:hypothetical protein